MYGDAVAIGDAAQIVLEQYALVDGVFDQFALDLDVVVDAQENLELFVGGGHLHLCRAYICTAQKDMRLPWQKNALGGVGDSGSLVGVLLNGGCTHVIELAGESIVGDSRLVG